MSRNEQDLEATIRASIAVGDALHGKTLTPADVDNIRQWAAVTYYLTGNQKRTVLALCESHERLRCEKILINLI